MSITSGEMDSTENRIYRKSLDVLTEHVRKVQDAVVALVNSFDSYADGNADSLRASYAKISEFEEEADVYKMSLIDQLTKAAPGLLYREDFLKLVVKVDEVAELAQSILRLLVRLAEQKWIPASSISEGIKTLAGEVLTTYEKLRDAVFALTMNPRNTIMLVGAVHACEAKVDQLYQELDFRALVEVKQVERLLVIRDLLGMLEHMTDVMEDASDDARVLALHRVA